MSNSKLPSELRKCNPNLYELFVIEKIVNPDNSFGTTVLVLDQSDRNASGCVATYREMRSSKLYGKDSQFLIMQGGFIVAMEVHNEMLWLANVPPKEYFVPPRKKQLLLPNMAETPKIEGFAGCVS